jgi:hypothetical protein
VTCDSRFASFSIFRQRESSSCGAATSREALIVFQFHFCIHDIAMDHFHIPLFDHANPSHCLSLKICADFTAMRDLILLQYVPVEAGVWRL